MTLLKWTAALMLTTALAAAPATARQAGREVSAVPSTAPAASNDGKLTRLVLLGTAAGPVLRTGRSQPASLVVVEGRPYLIDAGEGVSRQLVLAGYQPADIQKVFLTHLHFDHTAGLASLFAFNWINAAHKRVDAYGPPGTAELTAAALAYFSVPSAIFAEILPGRVAMKDMALGHDLNISKPTLVYQDDRLKVIAVENSHYSTMHMAPQSYGVAKSYSYRFETADRVIVFTGDTGPSDAVAELAKGADILVSEVIDVQAAIEVIKKRGNLSDADLKPSIDHMEQEHLPPAEVGKLAARAGVKMLVLSHIASTLGDPSDVGPMVAEIRKYYSGPVVAGRDLDRF